MTEQNNQEQVGENTETQQAAVEQPVSVSLTQKKEAVVKQKAKEEPARKVMGTVVKQSVGVENKDSLPEVTRVVEKANAQLQSAIGAITRYCSDMDPKKPQTQQSLEQHQLSLLSALWVVLAADEGQFKMGMAATIALIKANLKGCFSPTARNRGLNNADLASIDNKNMRFLTRVVDALCIAAGTNNMENVKRHVDMSKLFEAVPHVRMRQNLTAYFSM